MHLYEYTMAEYRKGAYRQGTEIDPVAARPLGGTGGRAYNIYAFQW